MLNRRHIRFKRYIAGGKCRYPILNSEIRVGRATGASKYVRLELAAIIGTFSWRLTRNNTSRECCMGAKIQISVLVTKDRGSLKVKAKINVEPFNCLARL